MGGGGERSSWWNCWMYSHGSCTIMELTFSTVCPIVNNFLGRHSAVYNLD